MGLLGDDGPVDPLRRNVRECIWKKSDSFELMLVTMFAAPLSRVAVLLKHKWD